MVLAFVYHPEAEIELDNVTDWYADRDILAALRFQDRVENAIELITEWPESGGAWQDWEHGEERSSRSSRRHPRRLFPCVVYNSPANRYDTREPATATLRLRPTPSIGIWTH